MAHAHASPSSSEIWIACPASVTKARGRQRKATSFTREGTAAHTLAERVLKGKKVTGLPSINVEGEDIAVTEEMVDGVATYVSYVESLKGRKFYETVVHVQSEGEDLWGTADAFAVDAPLKMVEIVDLKYGQGVWVPADAPQFRIYALGVLDAIGPFTEIDFVKLTVVQPRAGDQPIRSVVISVDLLIEWEKTILHPALVRLKADDPTETPGDHCRWCVRAGECKALADLAMANAKVVFGASPPDPHGMSDKELGELLTHGEMILSWVNKMRAEVSQRIDVGGVVPGWKLVPKRAVRRWDDAEGAILAMKQKQVPLSDILRIETIGTIEKVLKRYKVPVSTIDPYTIKQSSGTTLVSESDGRPAVDTSSKNVFSETETLD
jgi:hypothetical protein